MKITILKVEYNETNSEFTRVESKMTGLSEDDRIFISRMVDEVLATTEEDFNHLKNIKGSEYYLVLNQELFIASILKLKEYGIKLQVEYKSDYINLSYVSLELSEFNGMYNVTQNKVEGLPMWGTVRAQKFFKDLSPLVVPYFNIQLASLVINATDNTQGVYIRFSGDMDKLIDILLDKCRLSEEVVNSFDFVDDNTVVNFFDTYTVKEIIDCLKDAGIKLKLSILSDCIGTEYTSVDNSAYFGFYNQVTGEVEDIPAGAISIEVKTVINELSESFPLLPKVGTGEFFPFPKILSSNVE